LGDSLFSETDDSAALDACEQEEGAGEIAGQPLEPLAVPCRDRLDPRSFLPAPILATPREDERT